jgi:glycosyltransferase involved in cell wall biosynthesis
MKILFIKGQYDFCYYYRGYLPGSYSGCMVTPLKGEIDVKEVTSMAQQADVVVLQRPNDIKRLTLMQVLKKMGKNVIFENDDTYLADKGIMLDRLESDKQREIAKAMSTVTNACVKMADGVIASTDFLAEEYRQLNPNVAVLKNCIDPLDEIKCRENTTGKFRVGFIGSVTTNDDYVHIKDQIKKLDGCGDVTIVVFGIKYKDGSNISFMNQDLLFWNSLKNIEWQHYVHVTEYLPTVAKLALDLIIIPRQESYFNRAKSNLKFLEASLLRIPVLAQGFSDGTSPYEKDSHVNIVVDNATWYDKIIEIKNNYSKYKKRAEKAHDYVLKNYNIRIFAKTWIKTIKKICKSK